MTRLYAHRGAAAEQPENTIASFEKAVGYGVHGLEMDVHMSSDGVVVVAHDDDGQRMCRESLPIKETSYAELRQWDAGWGFTDDKGERPFFGRGYQIPSLAEVLEHFPDQVINVDLKQSSPSMVGAVLKIVRDARAVERVILASFSQSTLLHLRCRRYQGITAMGKVELIAALYARASIIRRLPLRGLAAQIPVSHGSHLLATKENIARLQGTGARVDFWTINDPAQAKELLELGADGIMTDDPKAIAPVFAGS